jgi:polar amino acid transport system permease protein
VTEAQPGPLPTDREVQGRPRDITAIPVPHPWRWVAAAVVVIVAASVVYTVFTAPSLRLSLVPTYLLDRAIFEGISVTLQLTVVAMVIGIALGVVLAVMRVSSNPVLGWVSWFYLWFFRGTPALVQIFFWFNLAIVLPYVGLGVPGTPFQWQVSTNVLISAFVAASVGLGLNEAAFMAEIVRAGFLSVEMGQMEAAQALGLTQIQVMRRIVIPQAVRVIIPPTGNETIGMLKGSSLAFVAAVPELYTRAHDIANTNYYIVELLMVASIWYLFMTTILTIGQYYLERHYARGSQRELPPTPFQRLRRLVFRFRSSQSPLLVGNGRPGSSSR